MDINDARVVMTVLAFVSFMGIVLWAYSSKSKKRFDEAARLPFDDDERRGPHADGRDRS
ncbi:MAG: cbb3-type cytochrome oxidase subunit 3 [Pseudomonadota bacterium]